VVLRPGDRKNRALGRASLEGAQSLPGGRRLKRYDFSHAAARIADARSTPARPRATSGCPGCSAASIARRQAASWPTRWPVSHMRGRLQRPSCCCRPCSGSPPAPPTAHWPSASPFLPDWPSRAELRRLRVGEAAVSLAFRTGRRCHRILPARTGEADPGDHDRTSSPRRAGPRRQPTCPRPLRPAAWTSSAASAGSWCSRRRCGALSCLVAGYFLAGSK